MFSGLKFQLFRGLSKFSSQFVGQLSLDRPVFIVGPQRSGTRLIENYLLTSGELSSWSEANHIWEPHYYHSLDPSTPIRTIPGFVGKGVHAHEIPPVAEIPLKRRVRELFWFYTGLTGKRLLHKNPFNSVRVDLLLEWFGDSKIVHISRDARAAVNSFVQKNLVEEIGDYYSEVQLAKKGAYRWDICETSINEERERKPGRIARIRYADLEGERGSEVLRKLFEFCRLDTAEAPWQKGPEFDNRNYKWQNDLSEPAIKAIEEVTGNPGAGQTSIPDD